MPSWTPAKKFFVRGIPHASIEEIAMEAGACGAVYWHFKNKSDLCDAMARRIFVPHEEMLQTFTARLTDTPIDNLKDMSLQAFRTIANDRST